MKKFLILGIIVVVAVLVWWGLSSDQVTSPENEVANTTTTTATEPATTAGVETELQGLGDEDLDAEMMAIDADLKAL